MSNVNRAVRELTRVHTTAEHVLTRQGNTLIRTRHLVKAPPLLDQLRYAEQTVTGQERAQAGYRSQAAARLEGLDTLILIENGAQLWFDRLGLKPPNGGLKRWVSHLNPHTHDHPDLGSDILRWWTQARIISGWDVAPFRPRNTCPSCELKGTLRIRIESAQDVHGFCIECRATWSSTQIGLLAEHIRTENHDQPDTPATA